MGPSLYIDPRIRRRFLWLYLLEVWIALLLPAFLIYWFFSPYVAYIVPELVPVMPNTFLALVEQVTPLALGWRMVLFPLQIMIIYVTAVIWALLVTKCFIGFLHLLHPPQEGVFYRSPRDPDYCFWNLRNLLRVYYYWLLFSIPLTGIRVSLGFRAMGLRVGKRAQLTHCWLSPEFVTIGHDVIIGIAAAIYSFQLEDDKLVVATVRIEDHAILGPQVVLHPGTVVGHHAVLDGGCFTHPFTIIEPYGLYHGTPAQLVRKDLPLQEERT